MYTYYVYSIRTGFQTLAMYLKLLLVLLLLLLLLLLLCVPPMVAPNFNQIPVCRV
jgi:hypothetical protein